MASGTTKTPNDESPNGRNGRRYSPIGKCQSGRNDKNECCPHHCGKAGCTIKYISETSRHFATLRSSALSHLSIVKSRIEETTSADTGQRCSFWLRMSADSQCPWEK